MVSLSPDQGHFDYVQYETIFLMSFFDSESFQTLPSLDFWPALPEVLLPVAREERGEGRLLQHPVRVVLRLELRDLT